MKKSIVSLVCFLGMSCFVSLTHAAEVVNPLQIIQAAACPMALPTDNPGFCASFKAAAKCRCTVFGLPDSVCTNMSHVYDGMIVKYGSVDEACTKQKDAPAQICKDDWKCYRQGGTDASGRVCSSTGKACP